MSLSSSKYASKAFPQRGAHPDFKADAARVAECLLSGGIAIVPTEQGYGLLASDPAAVERSFATKRRKGGHPLGIIGNYELSRRIHILAEERFEMIRVWAQELDMSTGVVGPYRQDDSLLTSALDAETLAKHTKSGTLGMFVGGPPLLREIVSLVLSKGRLVLGSSANLTGTGQKFRLEDVEDEVKEAADIIVNYGLQRAHVYGVGTTNFDFENLQVLRFGSCYEIFKDYMGRFWDVELPDGPPVPKVPSS
jgi:tRNA A37 threonylcarbamoyladenosine synthetase subunit TsaC/SUA5/YrdC